MREGKPSGPLPLPRDVESIRVALLVSRFNATVTEELTEGALASFREVGLPRERIDLFRTPGGRDTTTRSSPSAA